MPKKSKNTNNRGRSASPVKEKLPPNKKQNTMQTTENEADDESSNITQPPAVTMEVDQTSDTEPLPLDKGKAKETDSVKDAATKNKKDNMNVDGPSDASENAIDTTLFAFAAPLLNADK